MVCVLESHLALLTFNCCECAQCAASERETTKQRHKFPAGHIREKAFAFSKVWLRMHLFVYCLKHLIAQTVLHTIPQYMRALVAFLRLVARTLFYLPTSHDIGKKSDEQVLIYRRWLGRLVSCVSSAEAHWEINWIYHYAFNLAGAICFHSQGPWYVTFLIVWKTVISICCR